jgi:WD40 repeat protein
VKTSRSILCTGVVAIAMFAGMHVLPAVLAADPAAAAPPVVWGGGLRIPFDAKDTFICPSVSIPSLAVVGDTAWDLKKGQPLPQKLEGVPAERLPSAVSSDGSLFASVAGSDNVFEKNAEKRLGASAVIVWSISTGQPVNSLAPESVKRRPRCIAFAGPSAKDPAKWLVAIGPNDPPRKGDKWNMDRADVWDLKTGNVHHSFLVVSPVSGAVTVSPDAGYLAVVGNDHVHVYDIRGGREVAVMKDPPAEADRKPDGAKPEATKPDAVAKTAPAHRTGTARHATGNDALAKPHFGGYGSAGGLAFSPDGRELAGLFSGRLSHNANRLIIWDSSGHVTFDSLGHQLGGEFGGGFEEGMFRNVQWSPDKTQLLIAGGWLIDRKTGATVWHVPLKYGQQQQPIFLDDHQVLAPRADAWETCEIPLADIKTSLAALADPKVEALLRPDQQVSVAVDLTGNIRGDAGQTKDALTKAITSGLSAASFAVGDGQSAVFHLAFEEAAGRTAEVYETRGFMPFGGKDTGQKATGTTLKVTVELRISGSSDPVWSQELDAYSPQAMAGPVNDDTLRTAALNDLCWQLNRMVAPTFIPADKSIKSLPIIAE